MPNKIKWTGREFGKYIQDKPLIRKKLKGDAECHHYKAVSGDFYIHEDELINYPDSWVSLDEERVKE